MPGKAPPLAPGSSGFGAARGFVSNAKAAVDKKGSIPREVRSPSQREVACDGRPSPCRKSARVACYTSSPQQSRCIRRHFCCIQDLSFVSARATGGREGAVLPVQSSSGQPRAVCLQVATPPLAVVHSIERRRLRCRDHEQGRVAQANLQWCPSWQRHSIRFWSVVSRWCEPICSSSAKARHLGS